MNSIKQALASVKWSVFYLDTLQGVASLKLVN